MEPRWKQALVGCILLTFGIVATPFALAGTPPGNLGIHREPGTEGDLRLANAPPGWTCRDDRADALVTAGERLVGPNPSVTCAPEPFTCRSVRAGGYHAVAGSGSLFVTSACTGLSVTQQLQLPFRDPGMNQRLLGSGDFAWRCSLNEASLTSDLDAATDYWAFCDVNVPGSSQGHPAGHLTIHRFPATAGGLLLLASPRGWTCRDDNNGGAIVSAPPRTPLVGPNPSVTCVPPPLSCANVVADVPAAGPGSGSLSVTSACGGLSVTQDGPVPRAASTRATRNGAGSFPWSCAVDESRLANVDATGYRATCQVNLGTVGIGTPYGSIEIQRVARTPARTTLTDAPSGWACQDDRGGAPVAPGSALVGPHPSVTCSPPSVLDVCSSVTAGGRVAPAAGALFVTSACLNLAVTHEATATPEAASAVGAGAFPWTCSVQEPAVGSPDVLAYDVHCTVNVPGSGMPGTADCTHGSPHVHTYTTGTAAAVRSDTLEVVTSSPGTVSVSDSNMGDCDGDGVPGEFDGDLDAGVGGGFFGYGPWADEATCDYGYLQHGSHVTVSDVTFGSDIWFVIGADDTSGPAISVDPVTGETTCSTDGSITPGDPSTDPTADPDDCLTPPQHGSGVTCGAGGDGGYWVFLVAGGVVENAGGVSLSNAPTTGGLTA